VPQATPLAAAFLDALGERGAGLAVVELEPRLRALLEEGAAAWPQVKLAPADFAVHLARHAPGLAELAALHAGDLYLACACARGEAHAVAAFEKHYLRKVESALARGTPVEDVLQTLREKMLVARRERPPEIADYSGRGSLAGWVRVAAVRAAQRLRKDEAGAAPPDEAVQQILVHPELDFLKAQHRAEFEEAFRAALLALPARDRSLLRLHYVESLSVQAVGALHGVHRATATRWLAMSRQLLVDDLRRRLAESLRLSRHDVDSLVKLLRSRLDVSIRRALQ
jgi:RNA polymerase sigma-70 factor (ECF subfamily)